jgi:hypothetical protein
MMDIPGFSSEALASVEQLLYGEIPWQKQFEDGKGPGPRNPGNYNTGLSKKKGRGQLLISKTGVKGDLGKLKVNSDSEMLSGPALEKGPGNPMSGSSKDVQGMRQLG